MRRRGVHVLRKNMFACFFDQHDALLFLLCVDGGCCVTGYMVSSTVLCARVVFRVCVWWGLVVSTVELLCCVGGSAPWDW